MSLTAQALWYIESHLTAGDLSLDAVADSVHVSRFHLSRAFTLTTGQSLTGYARARRLTHAAQTLAQGAPDILAVALAAGYGSHEAFTRAFRQHFALTPEQVRKQPHLGHLNRQEPLRMPPDTNTNLAPPRLVDSEALLLFGLSQRHEESNAAIPAQWGRFAPHLGHIQNQIGHTTYGVVYNTGESRGCDYLCAVQVSHFPAHPPDFTQLRLPPRTYAVFSHAGHIATIAATWQAIFNQALADAGHRAADAPAFERYGPEFDPHTGLGGCEIWIPLA